MEITAVAASLKKSLFLPEVESIHVAKGFLGKEFLFSPTLVTMADGRRGWGLAA